MRSPNVKVGMFLVFCAGVFVGGVLAVTGRSNDVYLMVDHDIGVLPLLHHGDRLHWVDPSLPPVHKHLAPVPDISFDGNSPCKKPPSSTGLCKVVTNDGSYKYMCQYCGDPTIPVGSSTLPAYSVGIIPSIERDYDVVANDFFRGIERVLDVFPLSDRTQAPPQRPIAPLTSSPLAEAFVGCAEGVLTVTPQDHWYYPTGQGPLALGDKLKWVSNGGLPKGFTVQDIPNSTALATACNVTSPASYPSNLTGYTESCILQGTTPGSTIPYQVTDLSGACKMPSQPFNITVPATGSTGKQQ